MHPNPVFRAETRARHVAFARGRAFGQLTVSGAAGPLAAHVPFLLDAEAGAADLHLMRSNPVARALSAADAAPLPALLSVTGADGYVSPDWYGIPDQVPTWNYVAVHLRGRLERLEDADLREVLDRLSEAMERRLPKVPWHSGKMSPGVMERMMRALVPCRLTVTEIDGTWKLSQNKPDGARQGAITGLLDGDGPGQELDALAALMRDAMLDPEGRGA